MFYCIICWWLQRNVHVIKNNIPGIEDLGNIRDFAPFVCCKPSISTIVQPPLYTDILMKRKIML